MAEMNIPREQFLVALFTSLSVATNQIIVKIYLNTFIWENLKQSLTNRALN